MPQKTVDMVDYNGTIIKPLRLRSYWTPDFHELRKYKTIPLFIYGQFQRNGRHSHILNQAEFLGKAHTMFCRYEMRRDTKSIDVVFDRKGDTRQYYIRGEIYNVNVEHIHVIDVLAENNKTFRRISTKICLEDEAAIGLRKFRGFSFTDAFIYVAVPEAWEGIVTHSVLSESFDDVPALRGMRYQASRSTYISQMNLPLDHPARKKLPDDFSNRDNIGVHNIEAERLARKQMVRAQLGMTVDERFDDPDNEFGQHYSEIMSNWGD